jgi:hypothetical protein
VHCPKGNRRVWDKAAPSNLLHVPLLGQTDQGKEDETPLPLLSEEHAMDHAIPIGSQFPYVASELSSRLNSKMADFCNCGNDLSRVLIRERVEELAHRSTTR